MMFRFGLYACVLLLLSSCAGKNSNDLRVSLGLESAYETATTEFHQGLIMESRARILSIGQDDKDYTKAQKFFKQDIEPARLKLLRYYARKGKAQERKREWAKAEEAYGMAVELSQQPDALIRYKKKMQLKVRQLRLDKLYSQRKKEDIAWVRWKKSYTPPKGLLGDDKPYALARIDLEQLMQERVKQTWKLAERYEKKNVPELAWMYADSFLRLSAGDKKAQDMKNAMKTAVPKGFRLPREKRAVSKAKTIKPIKQTVSINDVKGLMDRGKWLQAKEKALDLRQTGNADADKLLEEIEINISASAEKYYQDANLAFRTEKIDDAVRFWQRAVDLKPNEQTYMDNLRRGKQIQERLGALKTEDKK